jgi:nicotinamide-nucleotide adenylyltransferase
MVDGRAPTGLYVGRFQPFHLGHLYAVRHGLKEVRRLIIVIGSSQKSYEPRHPFTLGERLEMVRLALEEARISPLRFMMVPIPDVEIHPTWVSLVQYSCPKFDIAYTNDHLTTRLLKDAGYKVLAVPLQERGNLSGTSIRERMSRGMPWEHLVPRAVASYIKRIHGVERVREITA